jgi:hypothetical protein
MKMRKILVVMASCILFLISSAAEGSEWMYFMQNNEGDNYYVDLESIKHSASDTVRLQKKTEPANPSEYVYLVSDVELDCKGGRIRVLKETAYEKNGKDAIAEKNSAWQNAGADNIDELLMEFICSLKKSED